MWRVVVALSLAGLEDGPVERRLGFGQKEGVAKPLSGVAMCTSQNEIESKTNKRKPTLLYTALEGQFYSTPTENCEQTCLEDERCVAWTSVPGGHVMGGRTLTEKTCGLLDKLTNKGEWPTARTDRGSLSGFKENPDGCRDLSAFHTNGEQTVPAEVLALEENVNRSIACNRNQFTLSKILANDGLGEPRQGDGDGTEHEGGGDQGALSSRFNMSKLDFEDEGTDGGSPMFYWKYVHRHLKPVGQSEGHAKCTKPQGQKWYIITYAEGEKRREGTAKLINSAKIYANIDDVVMFGPEDVDPSFKHVGDNNATLHASPVGLWLWKAYIIRKALLGMNDGDCACYSDSDTTLAQDPSGLMCLAQNSRFGVVGFTGNHREEKFTDEDSFRLMGMSLPEVKSTQQSAANYHCWQKRPASVRFATEWLTYSQDRRILQDHKDYMKVSDELLVSQREKGATKPPMATADTVCGYPNSDIYDDHREDQSVLSLVMKRWGIMTFPEPSQWLTSTAVRTRPSGKCDEHTSSCQAAAELRRQAGLPPEAIYRHAI
jgi:hypothetical protein